MNRSGRVPLISITLLSASALGYEILLMRLFSIIQWHHFAYMIISLALLGYGVSGTFVGIFRDALLRRFSGWYIILIALFGLSTIGAFLITQRLPLNPEEIFWDSRQPWLFASVFLLLAVPFFFAASAIALAFNRFQQSIGRLYGFDLFGAGIGSLGIVGVLFVLFPIKILILIGIAGLLTAAIASFELLQRRFAVMVSGVMLVGIVLILALSHGIQLTPSPYKELQQALRISGSHIVTERSSPLGVLTVMENNEVPLRHAPGLSLNATTEPPRQLGIFTDGGDMSVITEDTGDPEDFAYLDEVTSALPYHLYNPEKVLILGAGGGATVLQSLYHQVPHISAVELNPQIVELLREDYGSFSGYLYERPEVDVHIAEARSFVARSPDLYDLIQLPQIGAFSASSAGLYALNESYVYTVEAFRTYLQHLEPNGFLSINRWIRLPPRESIKLLNTAIATLHEMGVSSPASQIILIRSWQTSTLLIKNGEITPQEIDETRNFCEQNAFDIAWLPGIKTDETNQVNQLREPYFYQAAQQLLSTEKREYLQRYKFNLSAPTDDKPYFFHFFKWKTVAEIFSLRGRGGLPLLEWGYIILIATLVQAVVASIVLILLPFAFVKSKGGNSRVHVGKIRTFAYFLSLGIAFIFIEIAFIQKFILVLQHPVYAAATVITGFLVFAGLGSMWSQRLIQLGYYHSAIKFAVMGIAVLSLTYTFLLLNIPEYILALPFVVRVSLSLVLIAPLAVLMGLPMPIALSYLGKKSPDLISWAWGINGSASVIGAVLATLLAIQLGFSSVIFIAVIFYLIAAITFPRPKSVPFA